jgi:hypothetical protein
MNRIRQRFAQVAWMLGIWCMSVLALGAMAFAMRLLMGCLGMAT